MLGKTAGKRLPPTKETLMSKIAPVVVILVVLVGSTSRVVAQQQSAPVPWSGCCGMGQWPMMGPGMMRNGHGMMGWGMMGQQYGTPMMAQIPAPYNSMTNPLPKTHETVERGALVYQQNCAACHGAGDGPAGQRLSPPPANLLWLSRCRRFSGTHSCMDRRRRWRAVRAMRCPHSRTRYPKTMSGPSSPTSRPDCRGRRVNSEGKVSVASGSPFAI